MQFKLLTLALFASFFATGFTAPAGPGSVTEDIAPIFGDLTKEQSTFIKPVVDGMGIEAPNVAFSSSLSNAPVDGQPAPSEIVDKFYNTKLFDFIKCIYSSPQQ
ncbi:unnamed protein product [Rhizopus microsporus]